MTSFTQCPLFASVDHAFLPVLVDTTAKICVIFLLAAVSAMMLYKSSAAKRHLVWGVALLAFLLLPILTGAVPKWQVLPSWLSNGDSNPGAEGIAMPSGHRPGSSNRSDAVARDPSKQLATVPVMLDTDSAKSLVAASPEQTVAKTRSADFLRTSNLVFAVWTIGAGLLLLRVGLSRFILHQVLLSAAPVKDGPIGEAIKTARRQIGTTRHVAVYLSSRRGTPMTWGLLRTYLLLPADASNWDRRRLTNILLHELGHVKHHDTTTHILAQLVGALYWFHPLVWLAARQLQVERERACDDLVLRSGVRSSDYAEDLLSILTRRSIPCTALAIGRGPALEGRLKAILSEKVNRTPMTVGVLALALVVSVASTTALAMLQAPSQPSSEFAVPRAAKPESAASDAARQPIPRVNILCADAEGKPVPGAEVHLYQHVGGDEGRYLHFGPFSTDEHGSARGAEAIFSNELGTFDRWIYARVPGRLVGVARSARWTNRRVINPEGRVELEASRSVEGQVAVAEGFDVTKVVVRVQTMHVSTGPGDFEYESFPREDHFPGLDTALPKIFECRPDSEGRIRFDDVPVRGRLYLVAVGDRLGEAQWRNDNQSFDQPIQLTLGEERIVSGRVLTPDGEPAVGMRVAARLSSRGQDRIYYLSTFRAVTDTSGDFTIHGLPQAESVLSIEDPEKRWTIRPIQVLGVHPTKPHSLTLPMETGVLVSGRVFDPDGNPVEGASFSAIAGPIDTAGLSHDSTDANGRYRFRLPSGNARLYFNSLPDGFAYPDPQIVKHLDIKTEQAEIENLDFTIQRRSD